MIKIIFLMFIISTVLGSEQIIQQEYIQDEEPAVVVEETYNFKCEGRGYGYYADVEKACKSYHVCQPAESTGQVIRHSFNCPEGTFFSQKSLVCDHETDCAKSESLYSETVSKLGSFNQPDQHQQVQQQFME